MTLLLPCVLNIVSLSPAALATAVLALAVVVLVDFLRLPRSRYSTWTDAFLLYLLVRAMAVLGFIHKWRFVKDSENFLEVRLQLTGYLYLHG